MVHQTIPFNYLRSESILSMSYDVELLNAETREPCKVTKHTEGGTYVHGGSDDAELNVTYNYAPIFAKVLNDDGTQFNIKQLSGLTAKETLPILRKAVAQLGTEKFTAPYYTLKVMMQLSDSDYEYFKQHRLDLHRPEHSAYVTRLVKAGQLYDTGGYWKPTDGNAGFALSVLLAWAEEHPEAVWEVV